jgi:hypothetical protein
VEAAVAALMPSRLKNASVLEQQLVFLNKLTKSRTD